MREQTHIASKKHVLILGGGVSGLTAARVLQEAGYSYDLLEMAPAVGGLTRSIQADDFVFDYTGHLLHLARSTSPSGLPYAGLKDRDWMRIERQSFCHVANHLVTAPIQYNLRELPDPLRKRVARSYENRPEPLIGTSLKDTFISGFGQALSSLFLIPQNEKNLATSLERLSPLAIRRFFPPPDDAKIRAGLLPATSQAPTYNSQFWYPRQGGIEALVRALARPLKHVHVLQQVERIDLARRTACTRSGACLSWQSMLSSIPLPALCRMTGDAELIQLSRALTCSSTIVFNMGLRAPVSELLKNAHWIYTPDRALPFYRVGIYSNMSDTVCPRGSTSLYVEVGSTPKRRSRLDIERVLFPCVLEHLGRLGWIEARHLACHVIHTIDCAYVHFTPEREEALPLIRARLAKAGIFPIGRYGEWDYTSMEDAVYSAADAAGKIMT